MKVKICGIKDVETAVYSSEEGADFLGLNFAKESPREIGVKTGFEIFDSLAQKNLFYHTKLVGLFYKTKPEIILQAVQEIPFHFIQIVETDFEIQKKLFLHFPKILQISVKEKISDLELEKYKEEILVLDSFNKNLAGGSGEVFNWDFVLNVKRKYLLAGGLTPENVNEAIKKTNPYGVDVASGVESSKGIKDLKKITQFIKNAKRN